MTAVLVLRVVPVAPPARVAAACLGGGFVLVIAMARLVETEHSLTDVVGGGTTGLVVTLGGASAITAYCRRAHLRASSGASSRSTTRPPPAPARAGRRRPAARRAGSGQAKGGDRRNTRRQQRQSRHIVRRGDVALLRAGGPGAAPRRADHRREERPDAAVQDTPASSWTTSPVPGPTTASARAASTRIGGRSGWSGWNQPPSGQPALGRAPAVAAVERGPHRQPLGRHAPVADLWQLEQPQHLAGLCPPAHPQPAVGAGQDELVEEVGLPAADDALGHKPQARSHGRRFCGRPGSCRGSTCPSSPPPRGWCTHRSPGAGTARRSGRTAAPTGRCRWRRRRWCRTGPLARRRARHAAAGCRTNEELRSRRRKASLGSLPRPAAGSHRRAAAGSTRRSQARWHGSCSPRGPARVGSTHTGACRASPPGIAGLPARAVVGRPVRNGDLDVPGYRCAHMADRPERTLK